ncbi:SAM-dependent methyltransferase [Rhodoplanes roseus]|uniref:tRNA (N6-threonylcarbamoyladenosine(37)-N6)-methyltransferase TrmO n=1 Tax=Rhodoplanes roseus TaxID=29409 RepID=A0A327KWV1_9BRAD|nr:SAM-dependent methyltransferase [Rhodoplanes roseus]RAI43289.1 tRNA (N6-threonylcarbamoyladenosine(37)-N6)-methyltransferase TrmO [Rhodoplanes roseus]
MITLEPIGVVRGGRAEAVDDAWGTVEADIVLDPARLKPEATLGLTSFSHVVVVFHMHKVAEDKVETGARHPRERQDWPLLGILAQPARLRPNRVGVTTVALVSVDGLTLRVRGLDAIDGTPVLDIKPFITGFSPRGVIREPTWARELMQDYF